MTTVRPVALQLGAALAAAALLMVGAPTSAVASADYPQVGDQAGSEEFVDTSTRYRSCKKLRVYYPRGVAKSTAAKERAIANGYGPAQVNKKVFKVNKELDDNKNRVVCEVSAARARKEFRTELLELQMPTAEAGELVEEVGYEWRVGSYDGVPMAVTMDYNVNRLTFSVNDGYVTDAMWG